MRLRKKKRNMSPFSQQVSEDGSDGGERKQLMIA
jgi:hypothetical protein